MSNRIKSWPRLFGRSSDGTLKQWDIKVLKINDKDYEIVTEHGKVGGTIQTDIRHITKGKNIGKQNETSVEAQAVAQADAKWTKQKERKQYTEDKTKAGKKDRVQFPMLAQRFDKRKHDITWPALVQPKLNGVRCLAFIGRGTVRLMSRKGLQYHLEHVERALLMHFETGQIVDGELFNPDMNFQDILSRVKRDTAHEDAVSIQFHIYDMAVTDQPFMIRSSMIASAFGRKTVKHLVQVETVMVKNEKELAALHREHVSNGYEGSMVRNVAGHYKFNHRSSDLQKVKQFEEEEFTITGGVSGDGRESGCVIFTCKTSSGKGFKVRPRGSLDQRRHWLKNISRIKGKDLTVRFLELSDKGVPQHPVGIAIRDYE